MTVRLSDDARRGWDRTCVNYGVSLTALLESMGRELDTLGITTERGEVVVQEARRIDQERRNRR